MTTVGAKLKEVGLHSIVYGLGSVAQAGVQFLLIPLLTAAFTLDTFGAFSLIQMVATIAGSIFFLGMTSAMPRSYFDYESEEDRKAVFTTAFLILISGAIFQVVVGLLWGRQLSQFVLRTPEYGLAIAWALAGNAVAFVNNYFFAWLRFLRKSMVSVLFSVLTLAGSMGLSAWFIRLQPGSVVVPFIAICVTQIVVMVVFLLCFGRMAFSTRFKTSEFRLLLAYGIPNVITGFAAILIDWSDRIIIERYVSLADAGIYSAAYRLGGVVNVLLILPFAQIWSPMMVEYRKHENIDEFFTAVSSYFFLVGGVIMIIAALLMRDVLPHLIRSLSGRDITGIVMMVMLGYLIYGYVNICSAGLVYVRKIHIFSYVYYLVALVKLGLNLLAIPRWGIAGAGFMTLVADMAIPIGIYLLARRYHSITLEWWRLTRIAAIVGTAMAYSLWLAPILRPEPWVHFPLTALALSMVYWLCLSGVEKRILKSYMVQLKPW